MANFVKDFTEQHPELTGRGICKRSEGGIHFGRGNGRVTGIFTGVPIHYLDGRLWKPIDTNLQELSGGWYGAPHLDIKIHSDGRVKMGNYSQFAELPGNPMGKVDGDKIIREFAFGEQRLILKETGFRQEIEITRPPTMQELGKLMAIEKGSLPGQFKRRVFVRDADNKQVTYNSAKDISDFLKDAVYPVVIDPDFTSGASDGYIQGSDATYSTARSTSTSGADNASIHIDNSVGFIVKRGFLVFDTSSIPDSDIVYKVNLTLTVSTDGSNVDFDVQIVKTDWSSNTSYASNATQRENAYDDCLADDADDSIWRNTSGVSEDTSYTSGDLDNNWVSKTGSTYYGLRNSNDKNNSEPADDQYIYFYSSESGTEAYRPTLTVLYTSNKPGVISFT